MSTRSRARSLPVLTVLLVLASVHVLGPPCVTGADLYVSSFLSNEVKRYDGDSGGFIDTFASGGGLNGPIGIDFGSDANLYVSSASGDEVLRYAGMTGTFLGVFGDASNAGSGLNLPEGLQFGPDGDLYVVSTSTSSVKRYSGLTGQYLGDFVSPGSGGLSIPLGLTFGPNGHLYVTSGGNDVKRYDGGTGAFIDVFASGNGLANGLEFGPDGDLYVTSRNTDTVKQFDGATGLFVRDLVIAGSGGLDGPMDVTFGPDGNAYVTSFDDGHSVLRYNGATGAFIDVFAMGGGLDGPTSLVFHPVTGTSIWSSTAPGRERTRLSLHPNPFNPDATIDYALLVRGEISLRIYTSSGRLVRGLVEGVFGPGEYSVGWDGHDDAGRALPSGTYIFMLELDGATQESGKAVLLK